MLNRLWRPFAVAVLVLSLVAVGGTAVAKSKKAPNKATLRLKAPVKVKLNKFFRDGAHFEPGNVVIGSGGTLTLKNKSDAPHTVSIVAKKDLPKSTGKILGCGAPGTICDTIFTAHTPDPDGNPTKLIVDVGAPGIDAAGDSIWVNPKQTVKVNVSAAKGTTLNFVCAIHAWMQGKLKSL
jgi:plastocyanin